MYKPDELDRRRIAWIISITLHLIILAGLWAWENASPNEADRIEQMDKKLDETRDQFTRS